MIYWQPVTVELCQIPRRCHTGLSPHESENYTHLNEVRWIAKILRDVNRGKMSVPLSLSLEDHELSLNIY